MQRSEQITAVAGAVLLTAAAFAVGTVLTLHGTTPAASAAGDDEPAPVDLLWLWFNDCQPRATYEYGMSIEQDASGRIQVEIIDDRGEPLDDPVAVAARDEFNACLVERRFELLDTPQAYWRDMTTADRLMLVDAYTRHVAPCLLARGLEPPPPDVDAYFTREMAPWTEVYYLVGAPGRPDSVPFDELLAARRACGVPTDILAHDQPG